MKLKRIICLLLVIVLLPLPAPTIFADDNEGRIRFVEDAEDNTSVCVQIEYYVGDDVRKVLCLPTFISSNDINDPEEDEHTVDKLLGYYLHTNSNKVYNKVVLDRWCVSNNSSELLIRNGDEADVPLYEATGVDTALYDGGDSLKDTAKGGLVSFYKAASLLEGEDANALYYPVRNRQKIRACVRKLLGNSAYVANNQLYRSQQSAEGVVGEFIAAVEGMLKEGLSDCTEDGIDDMARLLVDINLKKITAESTVFSSASYFRFYVMRDFYAAAFLACAKLDDDGKVKSNSPTGSTLYNTQVSGADDSTVLDIAQSVAEGIGLSKKDVEYWESNKNSESYAASYALMNDDKFADFMNSVTQSIGEAAQGETEDADQAAATNRFQEASDAAISSGDVYRMTLYNAAAALYNTTTGSDDATQITDGGAVGIDIDDIDATYRKIKTGVRGSAYDAITKRIAIMSILSQKMDNYAEDKRNAWYEKVVDELEYFKSGSTLPETSGIDYVGLEEEALSLLEEIGDNIDISQTEYRMSTWEARCKYWLSRAFQEVSDDNPYDATFEGFATAAYPEGYYIHPGVLDCRLKQSDVKIKDPQAYIYFVGAVLEAEYMVRYALTTSGLQLDDSEDSLNKIKEYVSQVQPVYETLVWLTQSDDVLASSDWRALMTTQLPDCQFTLQEVYDYIERHNLLNTHGAVTIDDPDQPLTEFFGLDDKVISGDIQEGIAYSSTYVPMSTNVYDAYTLAEQDSEFLKNFHYKYGFYRKALYRDTNVDAAVDNYTTGNVGDLKVCTLRDFLDNAGDTVLYIDDNLYNANVLEEKVDKTFNRLDNKDEDTSTLKWYERLWSTITDWFDIDIYEITKTAEETRYSDALERKMHSDSEQYHRGRDAESDENDDEYVLKSWQIDENLANSFEDEANGQIVYEDYNVLFSFAVVSAIYRYSPLFNYANKDACYKPVYIASEKLACIKGTNKREKGSLWNYALQRNLLANAPIGYTYNVDMNQPLYMDIYGNILTESGVVVVPAASNMTLFGEDYYKDCYSMGLWLVYGDDYSIPTDFKNIEGYMSAAFEKDEMTHSWIPKARTIGDGSADFARLTTGDKSVNYDVYSFTLHNLRSKKYVFSSYVGIILEVLRGAPIDYIDKNFEALNTDHRISEAGLVAAARFEELQGALKSANGNAMLSIPNPAFTDGFEYIALFAFKLMVIISIVIMLITIFIDVLRASLSFKTFGHCIGVVAMLILVVVSIPVIFQVTYYQTNRALLQDEAARIAMLNEEQRMAGTEIGVYTVNEVKGGTEMLLKLEDLKIPWWDLFYKVVMSDVIDEMEELMKDYTTEALVGDMPNVTVKNSGVYMSVNDLFDTADVEINRASNQLYLRTDKTCTASFFSPYYVIAESLLYNINNYNKANNWYSYTIKEQRGGMIRTVGLAKAYFTSTDFMDAEGDLLYLDEAHGVTSSLVRACPFKEKELKQMENALWTQQFLNEDEIMERNEIITQDAKEFIAENRDLLGRISDETFIKVMALTLAMKHNDLYAVDAANCFELYDLSQEDITRLSIAPDQQVMQNSTLNYARFVYEVGGTTAVYAAAFKSLIEWIGSYVKPLVTIAVFILIFSSIFVFKIVLRKESSNYYGYIITTLLLCAANAAHALLLKLSMYLPKLNLSATVCLLIETVCEIAYMCILGWVCYVAVKDWRNVGAERYAMTGFKIMDKLKHPGRDGVTDRMPKDNWQFFNKLKDRHDKRNKHTKYSPIISTGRPGGYSSHGSMSDIDGRVKKIKRTPDPYVEVLTPEDESIPRGARLDPVKKLQPNPEYNRHRHY